jgi:hypothetical protein
MKFAGWISDLVNRVSDGQPTPNQDPNPDSPFFFDPPDPGGLA